MIISDRDGNVIKLNQAGRQILPGAHTEGRPCDVAELRDLTTGRTLAPEERPLLRALRGEQVPETDILAVVVTTGEQVPIRASGRPLFGADGAIRGAIGIFTTIARPPDRRPGKRTV